MSLGFATEGNVVILYLFGRILLYFEASEIGNGLMQYQVLLDSRLQAR
jgi:hypothetical protein